MAETQLSPGVQLAWRIAGAFALETGAPEIEPLHFLYGLCSLQKAADAETVFDVASRRNLSDEIRRLSEILCAAELNTNELRAKVKSFAQSGAATPGRLSGSRRVSRSKASKALFDAAVNSSRGGSLDAAALLAAVCDSADSRVRECLGDKANSIATLARPARDSSQNPAQISLNDFAGLQTPHGAEALSDDVAIVDEIDAGASLPDLQPGEEVGKRFTFLYDLAWQFGTEGSLDAMLQHALDELLKVVPAAEHGQILVREAGQERLSLKAHSSGTTPLLSMTSIRQAIAQKKGFLWKKSNDLSLSQKEANLESGLYVPLLADSEVFGVICLGTSRSQPQFQTADLQLANALATNWDWPLLIMKFGVNSVPT